MTTTIKNRITSIDFLRGTIMIIMALDHVRDYLFKGSFIFDPLDLDKTSGILFFYPLDNPFLRAYIYVACRHLGIF